MVALVLSSGNGEEPQPQDLGKPLRSESDSRVRFTISLKVRKLNP